MESGKTSLADSNSRAAAAWPRDAAVRLAAVLAFAWLLLATAWLCDDAYITLRTAANYLSGYGLVWNIGDRVQSYTHPLWLLLLILGNAATGEAYYATIGLSLAVSIAAAAWLVFRVAPDTPSAILAAAALLGSKAFVDYSTSGLENPLSHLLLVLFYWQARRADTTSRGLARLALLGSLLLLNRLDLAVLVAPVFAWLIWTERRWTTVRAFLTGAAPLIAWELFSIIYYGFPFPNTAYAKLDTGVPLGQLIAQGIAYLAHTVRVDWATALAIAAGLAVGWLRRDALSRALAIGVALHLAYLVKIGGDFMGGRMLTAPFLVCVLLLADARLIPARWTWLAAAVAAGLGFLAPLSPLATPWTERIKLQYNDAAGIADEPAFYFANTGLTRVWAGTAVAHEWEREGRRAAAAAESAGGAVLTVHANVGFLGYYAGPRVYIVDELALTDAFLARMPPDRERPWRIGHTYRVIPPGYLESLQTGEDRLADAALRARFEQLQRITRGPIFDGGRAVDILRANLASAP